MEYLPATSALFFSVSLSNAANRVTESLISLEVDGTGVGGFLSSRFMLLLLHSLVIEEREEN
jgi:hypothetical protein